MLKGYFNFSGFVVSDWGACHGTDDFINGGLDIQMPDGSYFNEQAIGAALKDGNITMAQINASCVRHAMAMPPCVPTAAAAALCDSACLCIVAARDCKECSVLHRGIVLLHVMYNLTV